MGRRPNKCQNADRYKARRSPKCNNGLPCRTCLDKWLAAQGKATSKDPEAKMRKCLRCGNPFESQWIGNRLCLGCSTNAQPACEAVYLGLPAGVT